MTKKKNVKKKVEFVKIRNKGEITLPKPIREHLKLEPGDQLRFDSSDDKIIITKIKV